MTVMTELNWYISASADDLHEDEEVDLMRVPGLNGVCWAYVALESEPDRWTWGVLDQWLWDDAETIASGEEATKEAAKAAVQKWVEVRVPNADWVEEDADPAETTPEN